MIIKESCRMPQIYRYDFIVTDDVIDENGHVNNIEYLRWMQEAAMRHADSQGCTLATKAVGATWVVRSHRIEYLKPAFSGEHISVLTWVSNVRRVQSLRKYRMVRLEDHAVLAEAETDWIFVDAKSGRLRSIPKELSTVFEVVPQEREQEILAQISRPA
jgi:acyl-CoA thioester hydrolase